MFHKSYMDCEFLLLTFRQLDIHLLEKMKLNCQVFKGEISVVHLTRQVAHLQNALQGSYVKVIQPYMTK